MIPASDYLNDSWIVRRRIRYAVGIVALLALILVTRLAYLQIFQHQRFSTLARDNHVFFAPLAPVRGLIQDRNGVILAQNVHAYNLEILPERVRDMARLLKQLGRLVALGEEDVSRFKALLKRRPSFEWQILQTNLDEEEAARVALHQHRYPGVELRARLQRNYPEGALAGGVVGYVGRINADDLKKIDKRAYRGLRYIGRSGIEAHYESILRGTPGVEQVEINAHGRVVRSLGQTAPDSGRTVRLSLDLPLQRKSIEALQGYEGAIVAMAPDSGEVLAFVGAPGFDPNPFVNGISNKEYAALRAAPMRPLLNRALYGRYAPGSTIKGFLLLVGLENGIDRDEKIDCPGWYSLPERTHRYRDWKREGHGSLDARGGLVQSCDVYFYQMAQQLGIERMHEGMTRLGFGKKTGIDLPDEPSGLMPSPEWKSRTRGQAWYPGETVITGIGQGYMLVTPLQLAATTATLANRGQQVTPQFLQVLENPRTGERRPVPPKIAGRVELKHDDAYDYVIAGMREVVHGPKGTARGISRGLRYEIAGKTGTAQVKSIPQDERYVEEEVEKQFRDHSLFVGFAPLDDPKIAIAVVVEHAGSGSRTAAPIARKLMDYYLLERLGLFSDSPDTVAGQ